MMPNRLRARLAVLVPVIGSATAIFIGVLIAIDNDLGGLRLLGLGVAGLVGCSLVAISIGVKDPEPRPFQRSHLIALIAGLLFLLMPLASAAAGRSDVSVDPPVTTSPAPTPTSVMQDQPAPAATSPVPTTDAAATLALTPPSPIDAGLYTGVATGNPDARKSGLRMEVFRQLTPSLVRSPGDSSDIHIEFTDDDQDCTVTGFIEGSSDATGSYSFSTTSQCGLDFKIIRLTPADGTLRLDIAASTGPISATLSPSR